MFTVLITVMSTVSDNKILPALPTSRRRHDKIKRMEMKMSFLDYASPSLVCRTFTKLQTEKATNEKARSPNRLLLKNCVARSDL